MTRLAGLVEASRTVGQTSRRLEKVALLADFLRSLPPEEVPTAVSFLTGRLPSGPAGIGPASLRHRPPAAQRATLSLPEVADSLFEMASLTGPGSQKERQRLLEELLARATPAEQDFLQALLLGEVRQGALEGLMVEAVAQASEASPSSVRKAVMLAGDIPGVARLALEEGHSALQRVELRVGRPLKPMLAQSAPDLEAALERIRPAIVEWKLDGARIQVHRLAEEVRIFSRTSAEVSDRLPEVIEQVRGMPAHSLVLDGEVLALAPDGRPQPFQVTMGRFATQSPPEEPGLTAFFFDCLHAGGEDLVGHPARERLEALDRAVPPGLRVPRLLTDRLEEASAFLEEALGQGHEGVMVKDPDAPYEAGRRGASWLKVKPVHTIDLVVLAAEWGHGRRQGFLSNIHLGARDPVSGGYVMLGKTFKGMTDEMLAWQTERFLELETGRRGHVVHLRPELVVEVAFDGVQESPRYPGGLALRFARVVRYRPDKQPEEADTIQAVRALWRDHSPRV